MDRIKPGCESLFRRRRRSKPAHDNPPQGEPAGEPQELQYMTRAQQQPAEQPQVLQDMTNAQQQPEGEPQELHDIPSAQEQPAEQPHELHDIPSAQQQLVEQPQELHDMTSVQQQPAADTPPPAAPDEDAASDFKFSVYEEPRDELTYEIGKMIAAARRVWEIRIPVNPEAYDWRRTLEFEDLFAGTFQQGRPHPFPDTTDFENFTKRMIMQLDEDVTTIPLHTFTRALGQILAHCKAHFYGFDIESIDHAPMSTVLRRASDEGNFLKREARKTMKFPPSANRGEELFISRR